MWDFFYTCRLVAVKTSFTHKPSPDLKSEVGDFPDEHHRKQTFTMVNEQNHVDFTSEQQALPNRSVSQRVSVLNTETNIRQHTTKKTTTNAWFGIWNIQQIKIQLKVQNSCPSSHFPILSPAIIFDTPPFEGWSLQNNNVVPSDHLDFYTDLQRIEHPHPYVMRGEWK